MKRIFFTAILFLILTINSQANNSVIIFYKNDCPYCMEMRESLNNDAEFRKYMNQNFVVTLVDIQSKEGSAIAELYNVRAVPTILKYDEASGKTSVLKGFGSIKRLSGFLNSGVAPAVTATVKSQLSTCGNGEIEGDEQCDDGNMVDTDGCNNSCKIIERSYCGNGEIEGDEQCDDGNALDNDGCNKLCEVEQGWLCEGNPSLCTTISEPLCGNGSIEGDEQCDDGNAHDNDGCNKLCEVEQGWLCKGNPSLCESIVGISERKTISNSSLTRPVYPNPFTKNITISLFLTGAYDIDIFVIDVNGKITNQFVINGLQAGNNNINLDLSDLLPGNYILSLKNKDNSNLFNKAVRIRKEQ